ncbi:SLBB domain-containing protein [Pseudaeromonas paramecii]|uniref:Polysaccharide export protein EpsE n=1 Tax=Pseudaeromonas paramecii TaxID=2138166 RepID=A0ABP8PW66_9GAMM
MRLFGLMWLALSLSSAVWAADGIDNQYRLGPGDVVRVTVYDHADLALEAEIASDGSLRMPLVGAVALTGMTFSQAEARIAERLQSGGFVNHPQVNLFITQYRSQTVSVVGAVNQPGRYRLDGDTTLVGILATAGGIAANGGDSFYLIRDGLRRRYRLSDLATDGVGDELGKVRLKPNDQIYVPKQAQIYVYGEVQRPGVYPLDDGMTVVKAIAMAGGFTGKADSDDIDIQRDDAQQPQQRQEANLGTQLQAEDVVFVGESLF